MSIRKPPRRGLLVSTLGRYSIFVPSYAGQIYYTDQQSDLLVKCYFPWSKNGTVY